jgi:hypothetical protein
MPNWAENRLTISGEPEVLDEIATLLSTPYVTQHIDHLTNKPVEEQITGDLLLWNIIQPTDLDAYYAREKPEPTEVEPVGAVIDRLMDKLLTSNHWYEWNVRNWGTKWDISDAMVSREPNKLTYSFSSAWSCPEQAINVLAERFPNVEISLQGYDLSMDWALTCEWGNGEQTFSDETSVSHGFLVEVNGECEVCDDLYDDADRERFGCPSTDAK